MMDILCPDPSDGLLEVNTGPESLTLVSLCNQGFTVDFEGWDFTELVGVLGLRGESTRVPGEPGTRPNPIRVDETEVQVPMLLVGGVDHTGAPFSSVQEGRISNWAYLTTHVLSPPDPVQRPLGDRVFRVTAPGQAAVSFTAHVLPPVHGSLDAGVKTWSLVLRVHAGFVGT